MSFSVPWSWESAVKAGIHSSRRLCKVRALKVRGQNQLAPGFALSRGHTHPECGHCSRQTRWGPDQWVGAGVFLLPAGPTQHPPRDSPDQRPKVLWAQPVINCRWCADGSVFPCVLGQILVGIHKWQISQPCNVNVNSVCPRR